MAKKMGVRTVVVIRPLERDRLDPEPTVPDPRHEIRGCAVLPRSSWEQNKGWTVVSGRQVIAPYGADVLAGDLVEVDGRVWQVDGEPGHYEDRRGRGKGTMFYLKNRGTS